MKGLLIKLILVYQKFSAHKPNKCRMSPTCSNYAIVALNRFGVISGSWLIIKRLFRCGFSRGVMVDNVPHNIKGDFKWLI